MCLVCILRFASDVWDCCFSKVHTGTSAAAEGLQVGDIVTMIDDEFVCGMPLTECMDMLSGEMATSVYLSLMRVKNGCKTRFDVDVLRDFDAKPWDSAKEARKKDRKVAALAERSVNLCAHTCVFKVNRGFAYGQNVVYGH